MKSLHMVTFILLVIGGMLFGGQMALISKIIYVLVGLSAINEIIIHKGICKMCSGGDMK